MTTRLLRATSTSDQGSGVEPHPRNDELIESFARERGISKSWLQNVGIHICPMTGEFPEWVTIPYLHMTGSWGNKYRSLDPEAKPKYMNTPGWGTHLYNPYHHGPGAGEIWFAEGEFDTIVLNELGFPAIGIPGVGHADKLLNSVWLRLYRGAKIYIVFDGDKYGHESAVRLREGLDKVGVSSKLVTVPDGHDVNSWYAEDEQELREQLESERS